jgi:hypothetical protein
MMVHAEAAVTCYHLLVQAIANYTQGRLHQERQERGEGVCVGLRCSLAKQNGLSSVAPQQALGLAAAACLLVLARPIKSSSLGVQHDLEYPFNQEQQEPTAT